MNIHDLLATVEWSHPIQLNTKRGVRLLRKAPIEDAFWKVYKEDKETFKEQLAAAGISMGKFRDEWALSWWSDENLKFKAVIGSDNVEEKVEEINLIPLLHPEGLFEYQQTSVQMGVLARSTIFIAYIHPAACANAAEDEEHSIFVTFADEYRRTALVLTGENQFHSNSSQTI